MDEKGSGTKKKELEEHFGTKVYNKHVCNMIGYKKSIAERQHFTSLQKNCIYKLENYFRIMFLNVKLQRHHLQCIILSKDYQKNTVHETIHKCRFKRKKAVNVNQKHHHLLRAKGHLKCNEEKWRKLFCSQMI